MTHAIQAEGLVKRFGETTALAGADLSAPSGTVLAVLGPDHLDRLAEADPHLQRAEHADGQVAGHARHSARG
jgi:ABC-type uncharacterized transport system ATPase subunit